MEKTVAKFRDFSEAEKADREFYRKLSGPERLDILLQLSKLELLNSRGVEYVIVGAHSLAFYAGPGTPEILVRPSLENAEKLAIVWTEFGFAESDFKPSDFTEPDQMIQLGRVPNRIDLLKGISGVATGEAFEKRISTELAGLPVFMLSKDLLIQNKRAVGRPQDLADLDALS